MTDNIATTFFLQHFSALFRRSSNRVMFVPCSSASILLLMSNEKLDRWKVCIIFRWLIENTRALFVRRIIQRVFCYSHWSVSRTVQPLILHSLTQCLHQASSIRQIYTSILGNSFGSIHFRKSHLHAVQCFRIVTWHPAHNAISPTFANEMKYSSRWGVLFVQ